MSEDRKDEHSEDEEQKLRDELHEQDVQGIEELPEEEQEEVLEVAEDNPDPTTRREAIEQELMELGRSDAGGDLGSD